MRVGKTVRNGRLATSLSMLVAAVFLLLAGLAVLAPLTGWGPLYECFHNFCHQRPDRCFWIDGRPMAVCVRCFSIYLGVAFGAGVFWLVVPVSRKTRTRLLVVALVLTGMNVGLEMAGIIPDLFWLRSLLGFLLGLAAAAFAVHAFREIETTKRNVYEQRTTS